MQAQAQGGSVSATVICAAKMCVPEKDIRVYSLTLVCSKQMAPTSLRDLSKNGRMHHPNIFKMTPHPHAVRISDRWPAIQDVDSQSTVNKSFETLNLGRDDIESNAKYTIYTYC